MRLIRRDNTAVSPIIATILMVAITVVLAGVLYVMVMGLSGGSSDLAPLGSWHNVEPTGNTTARLVFGSFSYEIKPIEIKFSITDGSNNTEVQFSGPLIMKFTNLTLIGDNTDIINVEYEDMNWQQNRVSAGDKLHLTGLEPETQYTITVIHIPTQSVIQMSGATGAFETVP
jgi:flagellin-like protein